MRITVVAAICLCIVGIASGADAQAAIQKQTNIPAQGLGPALQVLAKDRNLQVVYRSEVIGKLRTSGAVGELTTDEAVTELLKGTGLTFRYLGENAITIMPVGSSADAVSSSSSSTAIPSSASNTSDQQPQEGKKSFWDNFRLAQANQGAPQKYSTVGSDVQSSSGNSNNTGQLTEVIVTAEKKSERLQDVPVPVSVLNADQLADSSQVLIRDYYASVPALNVSPNFAGQQMLSIRGITTGGFTNPTVGVLIDDVPYGMSGFFGGNQVPDIDPGDLARVEVLRGPQGTLYGANSMGGLIKYVTIDPSTDGYSGRIEAGTSDVRNGAEPGYNVRASVNIPISQDLAIRASAYNRQDPGYIDNPIFNLKGVNEVEAYGGRLSALWRPSDDFSLKLSALYQNTKANGSSDVDVESGLGDLQQNYINGVGGYDRTVQSYSAILKAKLGSIDLTSVTGYDTNHYSASLDYSSALGGGVMKAFGVGGVPYNDYDNISKFSQELRLSGSLWQNLDWLAGGFFTHENLPDFETFTANVPATGQLRGTYWSATFPTTYKEYAGFADLTYRITDRFDVQIGGRESHIDVVELESIQTGPLVGSTPVVTPAIGSTANAFTYLLTPRYKISPDLMVYARFASGYRPGGPNPDATGAVPRQYSPDKTQNYEIGAKGDFLDSRLSVDASVYYIDWKNIQIQRTEVLTFDTNGSGAKSQGVEISVTSRPLTGLTVAGWVDFDDAVLTQAFPPGPAYGIAGDRLPNTSRWSGNVSLEQVFPLWANATGFAGAAASYVGDRVGVFTGNAERQQFPSYTKTDVHAGVKYDSWTTNIYVNNVADVRGVLNGGIGFFPSFAYVYIQPRTLGVSVNKKF